MINIINKYHARNLNIPTIYCGRGSALGNPFVLGKHGDRDEVCDKYQAAFDVMLTRATHASPFTLQLKQIEVAAQAGDVNLECFCAPKRCHCETIKAYIERILEGLHE